MEVTYDAAKKDLEKCLGQFKTLGAGSEQDRAAQLVLQTVQVLQNRLDSTGIIKMLYLDNPEAKELLPETVYNVATQYVNGEISKEEAHSTLTSAQEQYQKLYSEMMITPSESNVLFSNNPKPKND